MRPSARRSGGGYSRFVRLARVALPLAALGIVAVVALRLSRPADVIRHVQSTPAADQTAPGASELLGARYEGVDERGRPYTLIADRATRVQDQDETISMQGLKADMTLEDKSWVSFETPEGAYAVKPQTLTLPGVVAARHDSGYELTLSALRVDLKDRSAASSAPVRAQGPLGELEAAGFTLTGSGDVLTFTGPVKARLRLKGA